MTENTRPMTTEELIAENKNLKAYAMHERSLAAEKYTQEIHDLTQERDAYKARVDVLLHDCDALRAEVERLKDWKPAAEYWYGEYRHMKSGEAEYPVTGALDAWFNGTWKAIKGEQP